MQNKAEVLWVGGEGGMEARLVERAKVPFKTIPAAGVHGVGLKMLPGNAIRLMRGFFAARSILHEFKPEVLFFTGGFVAVPMALAGMRVPTALYVPDIEPALALKTLARFADKIAVTAQDSFRYFNRRERLVLTGYPTRADLARWTRSDACRALSLTGDAPVLLVFGGSKGARSINNAVLANLSALLEQAQVIHITGELDWPTVEARTKELTEAQAARYHAFPYLHEKMGAALAAADLAVSRAGASTLGEYPLFGLPAVLVPYPYAWHYQKVNADALVQRGAAVMLEDSKLSEQFLPTVSDLLNQPQKLASMHDAMKSLFHPEAAAEIGRQILALCQERS
jgi:UDP-N-acetylglucosamine--N-acetylmuramyl-(pentapeptide) pyrophosphoryl-undecaprenol N-acetylglucosamine transferase